MSAGRTFSPASRATISDPRSSDQLLLHPLAIERARAIAYRIERLGEYGPTQAAAAALDILRVRYGRWLRSLREATDSSKAT